MTEADAPQYRQYRYAPPPGGTVILLVRHGESAPAVEGVEGPMCDGHTDPPLDPVGEGQALKVAERLQHEPLDAIYVSKLQRTQQTAAPLAAKLGIEPKVDPDIHEVGLGEWEGWKFRKLTAAHDPIAIQMFTEQRWDAIPGAESNSEFAARLRAGFGRIHAAHPNQRVAAFVHGGVIGMTMSIATGCRPFGMIGADNGSISEIVVLGEEWTVRRFNDTTHLEEALSTAPQPMA
ncbi:MAG TPA: histidine phosphatase family protein [Mycobacteriales bacterium]|nr:histidine phosphatase family protein [Mycobacteriales bacterium]